MRVKKTNKQTRKSTSIVNSNYKALSIYITHSVLFEITTAFTFITTQKICKLAVTNPKRQNSKHLLEKKERNIGKAKDLQTSFHIGDITEKSVHAPSLLFLRRVRTSTGQPTLPHLLKIKKKGK